MAAFKKSSTFINTFTTCDQSARGAAEAPRLTLPAESHRLMIDGIVQQLHPEAEVVTTSISGAAYENPVHYEVDISSIVYYLFDADDFESSAKKIATIVYWGLVFSDCVAAYVTHSAKNQTLIGAHSYSHSHAILADLYTELFQRLPREIAAAKERREIADTFYTHAIDDETGAPIKYSAFTKGIAHDEQYPLCIRPCVGADYDSVRLVDPYSGFDMAVVQTTIDPQTEKRSFTCPQSGKTVYLEEYYEDYEYDRDTRDSVDSTNPDAIRGRHLLNLACEECQRLIGEYYTAFDDLRAILESRLRNCIVQLDNEAHSYLRDCIETMDLFMEASRENGMAYHDYTTDHFKYRVAFCVEEEHDVDEEGGRFYYPVEVILVE